MSGLNFLLAGAALRRSGWHSSKCVPEFVWRKPCCVLGLWHVEPPPNPAILAVGATMAVGDLVVILGATASGKSELALELARRINGEILSVDSMQVYRGMDMGTAKPTSAEQAAVRHHLIDVVDPKQTFTAARFVEMAEQVLADARGRGAAIIATGGTPLYYKTLFEGMFDGPGADEGIRERLRAQSNDDLHARLREVDAEAAARIHLNDTKRMIRALEVYELTGQPISAMQREWGQSARHQAVWIGLDWPREELNRRINARVRAMIAAGWVDETRGLLERYGELSKTAGEATGYREMIEHVRGRRSLDEAVEQIKIATRQLARRQMKWFRRFRDVTWMTGGDELQTKVKRALELWKPQM
jgi:tRNA dimethylallyltransferase